MIFLRIIVVMFSKLVLSRCKYLEYSPILQSKPSFLLGN